MRYKCSCMYDGSVFHGFQIQENLKTIQGEIENALRIITKEDVIIHPSGRTDVGVHALNQVFHFDSELDINEENMKNAINSRIDSAILITNVEKVSDEFHSRYNCKSKEYHYLIDFGKYNPFYRNYRYYCNYRNMDIKKFKDAFGVFVGKHDFRSFTKNQTKINTTRTIHSISIEEIGTLVKIKIIGDGFLHHQIRILVAMALEVGRNKITHDQLKSIMAAKNRELAPKIAPPNGLYLVKVNY